MKLIMDILGRLSLRARLIVLFVLIKVLPLLMLGWLAWSQSYQTAMDLGKQAAALVVMADATIQQVGDTAINDATVALDLRAREDIERITTDTALRVADFLYDRDNDVQLAALLDPSEKNYRNFLKSQMRDLVVHDKWQLSRDESAWEPMEPGQVGTYVAEPGSKDNVKDFHYRPPVHFKLLKSPLYREMTFVGLDGKERIKVTTSDQVSSALKDVSVRQNTFARAENYFAELKRLKPGEIYVSDVVGTYVGSRIIGRFTPENAKKKGIPFEPEKHAYAGKENPVGKRFQGVVRWAMPVMQNGSISGWVTLALDHDHLMQFVDNVVPTAERYRDINDAYDGNYAFIWDFKGRSIVHPRHHSIVGYDAEGNPAVPWLEDRIYDAWKSSGKPFPEFIKTVPTFLDQLQSRKPAKELTDAGLVGLDCRYLNFAPQCTGWYNLADDGGSGSFLILWSGLWKLTTASAIPYYTGQYNPAVQGNKRGFGIVTVGANVADFHRAATESKVRLDAMVARADQVMAEHGKRAEQTVEEDMRTTAYSLSLSTLVMVLFVVVIAFWMASFLSSRIRWLNDGFTRFRLGERKFRFLVENRDEITSLAVSFNEMADTLDDNLTRLREEVDTRTLAEEELREIKDNLEARITERTRELSEINGLLRDEIEIRRAAEAKAQHLAGHDPLTGLANRMLFNERLQKTVHQANRSGKHAALLYVDLDRFKQVNDTLGHAVGDALLVRVAGVLQQRARKTDTVARLGGDEFAVILTDLADPGSAAVFAQETLDSLAEPIVLGGHEMQIYASIGIATFDGGDEQDNVEQIMMRADMAMYQAKSAGGTRFQFFENTMQDKMRAQMQLENELRTALEQKQFLIYYQPVYSASTDRVTHIEALLRWNHPTQGILTPKDFMDVAIRAELMPQIDELIMRTSCEQANRWLTRGKQFGRLSLNIMSDRLRSPGFVDYVSDVLDRSGLPPENLSMEIEEQSLVQGEKWVVSNMEKLRSMGIEIIIDNFGVELSSLQGLIEHPIDALKIDRAFVSSLGQTKADAIASTIVALAKTLNISIIAEGVETQKQHDFLETIQCDDIQGHFHAQPMPVDKMEEYLRQGTTSGGDDSAPRSE
ncbi:MAG: EAL domain-containing protein [Burkholderiaceae bacterium]|jgi:diguanylate cyclase (GGDEF)-like protein|nr:EAL domain-containing protein [Burkholderiaceae bacterium]